MKKLLLFLIFVTIIGTQAHALTCEAENITYEACKSGYYRTNNQCQKCPDSSGVFTNSARTIPASVTSNDYNADGLMDCYIPAGTYYDATGTFTLTANCNHD